MKQPYVAMISDNGATDFGEREPATGTAAERDEMRALAAHNRAPSAGLRSLARPRILPRACKPRNGNRGSDLVIRWQVQDDSKQAPQDNFLAVIRRAGKRPWGRYAF